jgi:Transcriptional regulator, AbiEi antitoxin/Protein of unknown function (DUF559)
MLARVIHENPNSSDFRGPRAIAAGQGGAISVEQLRAAGFEAKAINYRLRTGWLRREHRGVYSLWPLTPVGRMWAAVLATEGALSHWSAAAVWDLLGWPSGAIHVTTLTHRRSTARIRVHRSRSLSSDDITCDPEHGLTVTTVARLLADLTPLLTPYRLTRLCHRAEHLRILDVPDPCPRKLRAALDTLVLRPPQITRSEFEELFLALVARTPLPPPLVNHRKGPYTADFMWLELGLIVETDGARTHNTDTAFVADRRRDVDMKIAGLETLRFVWADVLERPEWVVRALVSTTAARRARAASSL